MDIRNNEEQVERTEMQAAFEDFQQTRFYKWCDRILVGPYHWLVLPVTGLVDAFVIVIPTEAVIAMYVMRNKLRSLWWDTVVTAFFAALGYVALALIASVVQVDTVAWLASFIGEDLAEKTNIILTSNIFIFAILSGALSLFPMPATLMGLLVGLLGLPLIPFALGVFIGKCIRFGGVAYVARHYGLKALDFYMRHATWVSGILLAFLLVYLYIK